jgi:hypothetical protein
MSLELSTQLAEGARGRAIGLLLGSLLAVTGLYACGDGDTDTDSNTNTNADTGTDTGTATGNKSDAGGNATGSNYIIPRRSPSTSAVGR